MYKPFPVQEAVSAPPFRPLPITSQQESSLVFILGYEEIWEITYSNWAAYDQFGELVEIEDGDDFYGRPTQATLVMTRKPRLEQHSNINGAHVRTIPGTRWTKPVIVAAGAGRVAVIDRGDSIDQIRVTDKYGGADPEFSEEHLLNQDFDWTAIADTETIDVPEGYRVAGLQIHENDVLVAMLHGDGSAKALFHDFNGGYYSKTIVLDTYGNAMGRPAISFNDHPKWPLDFYFMCKPDSGAAFGGGYDLLRRNRGHGYILPDGWYPIAATSACGIVNILATSKERFITDDPYNPGNHPDRATKRLWRAWLRPTALSAPPEPEPGASDTTFDEKDTRRLSKIRLTEEDDGLRAENAETTTLEAYDWLIEHNRAEYDGNQLADRSQRTNVARATVPLQDGQVVTQTRRRRFIDGVGTDAIDLDGNGNHTAEIVRPERVDAPLFYSLHTSHYDWLSEGGYFYEV